MTPRPKMTRGDNIHRTFANSVHLCLHKYADFRGRAPRAELWYFFLFESVIGVLVATATRLVYAGLDINLFAINDIVAIFFFLPELSVQIRRLHDLERSGWWYLVILIPLIGPILILIWNCRRGTRGDNLFGPENGIVENAIPI